MTKTDWSPTRRLETGYETLLRQIFDRVVKQESAGVPNIADLLMRLSQSDLLESLAHKAAYQMVTGLAVQNARTWREAARQSMRGREIYAALQREMNGPVGIRIEQLVRENAKLITNIPRELARRITHEVMEESQAGRRAEAIATDLRKQFPRMAASRIQLISRTEVSKASGALTQARAENLGLLWYVWRSSEDSRVRPSHRFMDRDGGIIIAFREPPSPEALVGEKSTLGHYHAGDCPNCRCYREPLLRLNQVQWPHRVYTGDRVVWMSRAAFERIAGAGVRIAA